VNLIVHGNLSFILEISSTKTCEWKVHVIFIHWKFTNDIQWMYEQFWNAWMNCNGIMGDQGEIKCWFNCWNSSQLNHKWAFSGWCANGCWLTLAHVVYRSKWTTTTPKTQKPNFFLLLVEFLSVLWGKKKIHWNRKWLKGSMEDKVLKLVWVTCLKNQTIPFWLFNKLNFLSISNWIVGDYDYTLMENF
jgi:hypothetical protein